ncbi:hypothetical protein F2P56_018967 [Juglans regia]|uniref:Uncharacterized protein n=1 Tax=Juglans regia TaxID=51240 RepID=A0A833UB19_JUGRE|nr:hypothetical protein F2P56_018967 [Juglans regia]
MRRALVHGELPRGVWDICVQWDTLQSRVAAAGRELRDEEDHACGGTDQDRPPKQALPWESQRLQGLGIRRGLRGGNVDDAAARQAGRLRGCDGGVAHGGGVLESGIWVCGVELEGPCDDRQKVFQAGGGG